MIEAVKTYLEFMPGISGYVLPLVLIMSLAALVAFALDKYKAKNQKWRIPEASLIALSTLGGAFGAFLGMILFRHKTKKLKFIITVPLLSVVWIILTVKSFLI